MKSRYYNVLRYSPLPNAIVELQTGKTRKNIEFYSSFLPVDQLKGALVFDVGANKGNKAKAFLDMGCKVICIEPEQKCLSTLHYRFDNNPAVKIINKGVADKEGKMTLHVQAARSGYNTLSDKWVDDLVQSGDQRVNNTARFTDGYEVDITTLDKLIEQEGKPFYIKIDVEGLELPVIMGLSHAIPYITFEAQIPVFLQETIKIAEHIDRLSGGTTQFKITVSDQVRSKDWMSKSQLIAELNHCQDATLEIICYSRQ